MVCFAEHKHMVSACPEMSRRHHHNVEFQFVYCLKGWFSTEFEGYGVQTLKEGPCWIQPPGIRHTVRDWFG
jgi:quercetin dioxygenase-like cupin family protein